MCFEIRIPLEKTKKDKFFYKVLITDGIRYYTPYLNKEICLGRLYETSYDVLFPDVRVYNGISHYTLSIPFAEGVYHLCKNKKETKRLYNDILKDPRFTTFQYKPIIVKACVPKGSLLIKGFNEPYCAVNKVIYYK